MRFAATSDWRDAIPFETPVVVAELVPGEPARCAVCGVDSEPLPRTQLWAVKHRHPNHHSGYVRFYCREHLPVIRLPEAATAAPVQRRPTARSESRPAVRRPPIVERERAVCPDCFVETSVKGVCGICGRQVG